MKKTYILLVFLITLPFVAICADPPLIQGTIEWNAPQEAFVNGEMVPVCSFKGGISSSEHPGLEYLVRRFPIDGYGNLRVRILDAQFEDFNMSGSLYEDVIGEQLLFETDIERQHQQYFAKLAFIPIIRNGNRYQRLTQFRLQVDWQAQAPLQFRDPGNTFTSALSDGDLYKVGISSPGIYQLSYDFLRDELGVDVDNINPKKIQLLGNGGGALPYFIGTQRMDDLVENPIQIVGEEDGSFDPGDYILFYAEGPDKWQYRSDLRQFLLLKNTYDDQNYYFLKIGSNDGLRISDQSSIDNTAFSTSEFDDYARLEEDHSNLMHDWSKTQGSGQNWFGDHFKVAREYQYTDVFAFPNLLTNQAVHVRASMALRARAASSFFLDINGESLESSEAGSVTIGSASDNTKTYAKRSTLQDSIFLNGESISFQIRYPHPQGASDESEGWLDYIQFNVRRSLRMSGAQMAFRDKNTLNYSSSTFQLDGLNGDVQIWDISDPIGPKRQLFNRNGQQAVFGTSTESLRHFIAFDEDQEFPTPVAIGAVPNQNIHGIDQVDMVIIYHRDFEAEALRLAQHRADLNDLTIELVEIEQVFNEFSSGKVDPTAIRDFTKMIYDRTERFRYLLLFGDGSFDARDVYGLGNNFIPVFQKESFNPVEAYPSDDYFGLLTGDDPNDPLDGMLGVAVGRLTVGTPEEAAQIVDKIVHYDSSNKTLGDWRNRLIFVGDDNDGPGDLPHFEDADEIAEDLYVTQPFLNYEKIYLDAFPQESTPGGERIPEATEALNKAIFKGALVVTYLGHGGSKGWAQERVLNISDILSWSNFDQLPIFLTATCSFTGYDDPGFTTAGEEVFLNDQGGAIALMTTVRAVYANSNVEMTENALRYIFTRENGKVPTIGDAFQNGKNDVSGDWDINNSRKFTLIGDPSMPIAVPEYNVQTLRINEQDVQSGQLDTIRALQKVTVEGIVTDENGQLLSGFNGIIYPTIYDKAQTVATLGQGANDQYNYRIQKNVIFKGRASVSGGRFQFTFVVPRDINYTYGIGKISYYAADDIDMKDAAGFFDQFIIGGTDPNALADEEGPSVDVYMNTEDFVFGGITDPDPTLLVVLEDDNGINVVGNSIGHDLEGVLDENTQNTYLLNDFYESELDDHTRGTVRYPLNDLVEGRHSIQVKAWDVANNSSTGYTEFVVASSGEIALEHVLNYPNPFTDRTCFQFDHNLANQELEVQIQIFTVSGRLVKSLFSVVTSDGAIRQDDCIEWDGTDDYGGQLARGIYLYKVKVRSLNSGDIVLNGESEFEKLVILK